MNLLEAERLLKRDASCRGGFDEAQIANEKDPSLEEGFVADPLSFLEQNIRYRHGKILRERERAEQRPIVKLNRAGHRRGLLQPLPLEMSNLFDEARPRPGVRDALGLSQRNYIGRRFFDNREAVELEAAKDGGFAGARCTG